MGQWSREFNNFNAAPGSGARLKRLVFIRNKAKLGDPSPIFDRLEVKYNALAKFILQIRGSKKNLNKFLRGINEISTRLQIDETSDTFTITHDAEDNLWYLTIITSHIELIRKLIVFVIRFDPSIELAEAQEIINSINTIDVHADVSRIALLSTSPAARAITFGEPPLSETPDPQQTDPTEAATPKRFKPD